LDLFVLTIIMADWTHFTLPYAKTSGAFKLALHQYLGFTRLVGNGHLYPSDHSGVETTQGVIEDAQALTNIASSRPQFAVKHGQLSGCW